MASSSRPDTGKPAACKAAVPDKPSFSQKCSLLSQYLKEKGTLGLGMTRNVDGNGVPVPVMFRPDAATTMNLFPMNEKPNIDVPRNMVQPMDLFPHPNGNEDLSKSASDSSGTAQKQVGTAQMTIFYAGQVMVFDDFPADKAKEVMMLARASSFNASNPHLAAFAGPNMAQHQMNPSGMIPHYPIQDLIQRPGEPIANDLPIARRASLQRFLEKRKDRITARSPYVVATTSEGAPSKSSESMPWFGLTAQPTQ